MARPAVAQAARLAAKSLESHDGTLPIDVQSIAQGLGIRVLFEDYDGDTSGVLVVEQDGSRLIGINERQPTTRQRFTIAHEIGHSLMHADQENASSVFVDKPRKVLFRDEKSGLATDRREIEANAFAAELLMPAELIRKRMRDLLALVDERAPHEDKKLVDAMAAEFEVSPQAMSYRLINLHLIDPT